MKIDVDSLPLIGLGSMMLGVRPTDVAFPNKRSDVPAILGTDRVLPGDGGLSCYDNPSAIKIRANNLVLWSIEENELPEGLIVKPAGIPHYQIEPKLEMRLDEFQMLLLATRSVWHRESFEEST